MRTNSKQYHSIHRWIRKQYGRPQNCENPKCDRTSKSYDWALKIGQKHCKDRNSYFRLCKKCHGKYDMTKVRKDKLIKQLHSPEMKKKRAKTLRDKFAGQKRLPYIVAKIIETRRLKSKKYLAFGEYKTLKDWSRDRRIKYTTLYARLFYYGFSTQ